MLSVEIEEIKKKVARQLYYGDVIIRVFIVARIRFMRILIALYKYFPWGGLQKDTLRIINAVLEAGHEVVLFTTSWEGTPLPNGLKIEKIIPKGWSNHGKMLSFSRKFNKRLEAGDVDVSLAMNRIAGADFYFTADSCLKTYLPQKHGFLARHLLARYRVFLELENSIFKPEAKTTIFWIAQAQKKKFEDAYHTPEERFAELPPGMNPRCIRSDQAEKIRSKMREKLHLKPETIAIIMIASNFQLKGADRTLQAIRNLPEKQRENCNFILVGNVNVESALQEARVLHLEKQVLFPGAKNNIDEYLLASDLMVHPARQEGTGTVLIEAIASGVPVICSGACGFSPYVRESSGAVLSEPFQQSELDAALSTTLAKLPELTEKTRAYAKTQNFCGRAAVVLQNLENFVQKNKIK